MINEGTIIGIDYNNIEDIDIIHLTGNMLFLSHESKLIAIEILIGKEVEINEKNIMLW